MNGTDDACCGAIARAVRRSGAALGLMADRKSVV